MKITRSVGTAAVSESDFTRQVIALAELFGWLVHHQRPGMTRGGKWCSAIQGSAGFPDLVMCRERLIWAELKTKKGQLSTGQVNWIETLKKAGQEVYVWRPSMWPEIEAILRGSR